MMKLFNMILMKLIIYNYEIFFGNLNIYNVSVFINNIYVYLFCSIFYELFCVVILNCWNC